MARVVIQRVTTSTGDQWTECAGIKARPPSLDWWYLEGHLQAIEAKSPCFSPDQDWGEGSPEAAYVMGYEDRLGSNRLAILAGLLPE